MYYNSVSFSEIPKDYIIAEVSNSSFINKSENLSLVLPIDEREMWVLTSHELRKVNMLVKNNFFFFFFFSKKFQI